MTTRRQFLQRSLLAGVSLPALAHAQPVVAAAKAPTHGDSGALPTGQFLLAGFGGKRQSSQHGAATSVVTVMTLPSGEYRQACINMPAAHSLFPLGNGQYLCLPLDGTLALFLDANLLEVAKLTAPKGFLFSGHGALVGGKAFISLRLEGARSFQDHGRLAVVDISSRQMIAAFPSGGVRPHDIAVTNGAGAPQLAVSHYGDINYEVVGQTHVNRREPRLVMMDPTNGKIVKTIAAPASGSLTHIAAGSDGLVCGAPLNYFGLDDNGRRSVEAELGRPFELSVAEELEGRIGAPMPLYLFDVSKGTYSEHKVDAGKQRRAQSVAYHAASDSFFVTYTFSDTVACVNKQGTRYVSAFDLGLSFVRGVCGVGQTPLVAVSGEFRGVTLVDAHTLKVVKRYDVPVYDSPHVIYTA